MIEYAARPPTIPIPFHRLLKVVALVDDKDREVRARPMLDYFLTFQESFNRFAGFNYEVQGVYQELVDGRIKFHTYAVRE
jgi:Orn/Lys/Arg decarboxylase, C-terminal domain